MYMYIDLSSILHNINVKIQRAYCIEVHNPHLKVD